MTSKTFNWDNIWMKIFRLIPSPTTNDRLIVSLDDSMTPKSGKKIFGCEHFLIMQLNYSSKLIKEAFPPDAVVSTLTVFSTTNLRR